MPQSRPRLRPFWLSVLCPALRCAGDASALPVFDAASPEVGAALRSQGVVLLRGGATDAEGLRVSAIRAWNRAGFHHGLGDYNSGGTVVRPQLQDKVYDVAAGAPADRPVAVHCEKAYQARVPRFVAFGCFREADSGGELQLVDLVRLLGELAPGVLGKLRSVGVEYTRRLGDEVTSPDWAYATGFWQRRFGTADWAEAQRIAGQDSALGGAAGAWLERSSNGTVVLRWRAPALGITEDGQEVLLSGILDNHNSSNYGEGQSPLHATYGDSSEFSPAEIEDLRKAHRAAEWASLKLKAGEAIVVDNFRFGHGRTAYTGERRHAQVMSKQVPRGVGEPLPQGAGPSSCGSGEHSS